MTILVDSLLLACSALSLNFSSTMCSACVGLLPSPELEFPQGRLVLFVYEISGAYLWHASVSCAGIWGEGDAVM